MTPNLDVALVPWDPESPAHSDRLYQQRIACGWEKELVESWKDLQRQGKKSIFWIVLPESDPRVPGMLSRHLEAWPLEVQPLVDCAVSLGGKPRAANTDRSFVPVGHITLESENADPSCADASKGIYRIATFYISTAIQGSGLGRAAMDYLENMATSPPLNAKTLTLSTQANEYEEKEEKWAAMVKEGREPPKISNQDWYARRGYQVYKFVNKMWSETDSKGRVWWIGAVYMRKDIK